MINGSDLGADTRASLALSAVMAFAAIVLVDLLFLGLHLFHSTDGKAPPKWRITADGRIPEYWQYAKWLVLVLLMVAAYRRWREAAYLAMALLFLYFLLDDSLKIHEPWVRG